MTWCSKGQRLKILRPPAELIYQQNQRFLDLLNPHLCPGFRISWAKGKRYSAILWKILIDRMPPTHKPQETISLYDITKYNHTIKLVINDNNNINSTNNEKNSPHKAFPILPPQKKKWGSRRSGDVPCPKRCAYHFQRFLHPKLEVSNVISGGSITRQHHKAQSLQESGPQGPTDSTTSQGITPVSQLQVSCM